MTIWEDTQWLKSYVCADEGQRTVDRGSKGINTLSPSADFSYEIADGLGSAACLGAATATMTGWCSLTVGAFICQALCALVVSLVAIRLNTSRLIIFGILFGTFVGSLGTIVVTNAPTGDLLKQYYLWGAANFKLQGVTTLDIVISLLLFITYVVVEYCNFGIYLPVSATMALIALPLTFLLFSKENQGIN